MRENEGIFESTFSGEYILKEGEGQASVGVGNWKSEEEELEKSQVPTTDLYCN